MYSSVFSPSFLLSVWMCQCLTCRASQWWRREAVLAKSCRVLGSLPRRGTLRGDLGPVAALDSRLRAVAQLTVSKACTLVAMSDSSPSTSCSSFTMARFSSRGLGTDEPPPSLDTRGGLMEGEEEAWHTTPPLA
jgi:hypothetical protein